MNQNNLTVTAASAATSLLLLGMYYPDSYKARRRRRSMNPDGEIVEEDGEYNSEEDSWDDNSEMGKEVNEKGLRSSVSSIADLSLIDETEPKKEKQEKAVALVYRSPDNAILKLNMRKNGSAEHSPLDGKRVNQAQHLNGESASCRSSPSPSPSLSRAGFKHGRRLSSDSEDSDISYSSPDDLLSHNFDHVHRGSVNKHSSAASDTDISITVAGTEWWCDSFESDTLETSSNATFQREDNDCIYLDYNGTTPIHPMVLDAMVPYFTRHFGNPSSSHAYGLIPRAAVGKAKRALLHLLHERSPRHTNNPSSPGTGLGLRQHRPRGQESSIVFTGCGTEADNLAIKLALEFSNSAQFDSQKKHIITSNVEHPAINEALKALQAKGECEVTFVPVNQEGIVSTQDVIDAIRPNQTILVTLMLANNESGALQPVRDVSAHCQNHGILFHTDAAQAVGKVCLSLQDDDGNRGIGSAVDMVTIVGHKMGAPKGVAALYIRPGCLDRTSETNPSSTTNDNDNDPKLNTKDNEYSKTGTLANKAGVLLIGGGQENGLRAGTENVPYIVGMGCAASLLTSKTQSSICARWEKNAMHMEAMRTRLLHNLTVALGDDNVRPNGPADACKRLPNTLSVGLKGVDSAEMLTKIQMHVACSAGSACHAHGGGVSPVLKAMGVPDVFARGTLRLSVGPSTSPEDVDKAARIIAEEARRQMFCCDLGN